MNRNGKFRILVVDDEASVLTTYRLILERQGYDVIACRTWREAIAAIERQSFDAVLCDYALEERHTGCEVIRAARKRNHGVPAALLTGYANQDTVEEAARQKTGVMFKPIEIEEFLDTTARMVRRNNEFSPQAGQENSLRRQGSGRDGHRTHSSGTRAR
ncbi:MAG TPA: response regulator [Candidatus Angelobacter sp.]